MKILVTGAAGGIGSTLSYLLIQQGHDVIAYDNLNNGYINNLKKNDHFFCEFIQADIRDSETLLKTLNDYKIEIVIHLAALTSLPECESNPYNCLDVNVSGTVSVLNATRLSLGQKVIIASTSAIYENIPRELAPFTEDIAISPRLFYPLSKKLMEEVIQSYIVNYKMDIVTLRFFNVFGPKQDIYRMSPPLINYIVKEIKNKNSPTFYSNGYQSRDYIHVDDVINLLQLCILNPKANGEVFNVCSGTLHSVRDIIQYASEAFNIEIKPIFKESGKFWSAYSILNKGKKPLLEEVIEKEVNKFSLGSNDKAKKILGWNPNLDIPTLMKDTMIQNYNNYIIS